MKRTRRQHGNFLSIDDPAAGGAAAGGAAVGAVVGDAGAAGGAAAGSAGAAGDAGGTASLLQQAAADGVAPGPNDWLPEKYRVAKDDGTIDEAASARKLAEAHKALESRLGEPGGKPPATAEEYAPTVTVEGVNIDELKADPMYQGFLKGAHAKGLTNDQVSYVLNEYLVRAPELAGQVQELNAEEARAQLEKAWGTNELVGTNLRLGYGALKAFATPLAGGATDQPPGSFERMKDKFANDPDFWAFAANIGKELGEDRAPRDPGGLTPVDADALMKSKAYWDPNEPTHEAVKAQVAQHFKTKFPDKK